MLYAGRGKPGWGRESTRPPWWPKELPWANVRMDARPEDEKQKVNEHLVIPRKFYTGTAHNVAKQLQVLIRNKTGIAIL